MPEPDAAVVRALREQLAERRRLLDGGAERVGWKIALGIGEVEERIGAQPVIGYLTSATRLPAGGRHSLAGAVEPCADAELAVVIGRGGTIAGYGAAIELVDLGQGRDLASVVRANVLHRAVVLGNLRPEPPAAVTARLAVDGRLREGAVDFDVEERVEAVRLWLAALGERLKPGDRIVTGSIVQLPVGPGDEVALDMGGLGRLAVTIGA